MNIRMAAIERPQLGQTTTTVSQAPSKMISVLDPAAIAQSAEQEQNKTYLILGGIAVLGVGVGYLLWKKTK